MITDTQSEILTELGIEQWVLRNKPESLQIEKPTGRTETQPVAISDCRACELACSAPFEGVGAENASLLVVSEHINQQHQAFSPKAQGLFIKMMQAIGAKDYYVTTAIKCPTTTKKDLSNVKTCKQHLLPQITKIQPRVVLAFGTVASQSLPNHNKTINLARDEISNVNNIPVISTFHPEYLLYKPRQKKSVWQDLLKVTDFL